MNRDIIEFYLRDRLFVRVNSSMVLRKGKYINIMKKTYLIKNVTFAVDDSRDLALVRMRQNVDLEELLETQIL